MDVDQREIANRVECSQVYSVWIGEHPLNQLFFSLFVFFLDLECTLYTDHLST